MTWKRRESFDYIRILLTLLVLLYHAYYVAGCRFGVLDPLMYSASVYMAGFYMLSGFMAYALHYCEEWTSQNARNYIRKKCLNIMPMSWTLLAIYYLFSGNTVSSGDISSILFNFTLMQNAFFLGNLDIGIWFLSVLLIWYIATPYLIMILRQLDAKRLLGISTLLCAYITVAPMLIDGFGLPIYGNWMFRGCEYILGMICARTSQYVKIKSGWVRGGLLLFVLLLYLYITEKYCETVAGTFYQPKTDFLGVLILFLLYIHLDHVENRVCAKERTVLRFLSDLCFPVFMATYPAALLLPHLHVGENGARIAIFLTIDMLFALLLYGGVQRMARWLCRKSFWLMIGVYAGMVVCSMVVGYVRYE